MHNIIDKQHEPNYFMFIETNGRWIDQVNIKFVKYSLYKFEKAHSALAWLNYYSRFIFPELPSSILEHL